MRLQTNGIDHPFFFLNLRNLVLNAGASSRLRMGYPRLRYLLRTVVEINTTNREGPALAQDWISLKNIPQIETSRMSIPFEELSEAEQIHSATCHNHTTFTVMTSRTNGMISAVASALIIHVILKSGPRLRTVYHRILFGMSCFDILGSLAVALNTLPMPKRGFYGSLALRTCYDYWPITRWGNVYTCEAQGFCFYMGYITMMSYNASLCSYYVVAIAFRLSEIKIKKYVEPLLHTAPLFNGLLAAVPPLMQQRYNPTGWEPYCTMHSIGCDHPDLPCYRGRQGSEDLVKMTIASSAFFISVIVLSLILVICQVVLTDRKLSALSIENPTTRSRIRKKHENARTIAKQAVTYIAAMVTMIIFPIFQITGIRFTDNDNLIPNLKAFFMPLVGLFNFSVFMHYKVCAIKKIHTDKTAWKIFKELMKGKVEEPLYISRISMLRLDEYRKKAVMRVIDENGGEDDLSWEPMQSIGDDEQGVVDLNDRDECSEGGDPSRNISVDVLDMDHHPQQSIRSPQNSTQESHSDNQGISLESRTSTGHFSGTMSLFGLSIASSNDRSI